MDPAQTRSLPTSFSTKAAFPAGKRYARSEQFSALRRLTQDQMQQDCALQMVSSCSSSSCCSCCCRTRGTQMLPETRMPSKRLLLIRGPITTVALSALYFCVYTLLVWPVAPCWQCSLCRNVTARRRRSGLRTSSSCGGLSQSPGLH